MEKLKRQKNLDTKMCSFGNGVVGKNSLSESTDTCGDGGTFG